MCVGRGGEGGTLELARLYKGGWTVLYLPLNPPSLAMAEILSLARLLDTSCNESNIR